MPYVDASARAELDPEVEALAVKLQALGVGELTYALTRLCDAFAMRNGSMSFADSVNDVVGSLECTKLEFYARVATPYEYLKRTTNGDAYPLSNAGVALAYARARAKQDH